MALIEITTNLDRVAKALERIATSLEIYIRPIPVGTYGKSELHILNEAELWEEEQEKERQRELGEPV